MNLARRESPLEHGLRVCFDSTMSTRNQLIQSIDDLLAFICKGMDLLPQLVYANRNELQRMQNNCRIFDGEDWVEARECHFVEV